MHIWIIINVLLIPWSLANGAQKVESDLELFSDEFGILARVTNAISLQVNAKDVKARDVIAELLKFADYHFNPIVDIDPPVVISKLKKFQNDVNSFEPTRQAGTTTEYESIGSVANWTKELEALRTSCSEVVSDAMNGLMETESQQLLTNLQEFQNNLSPILACTNSLVKFHGLTKTVSSDYEKYKILSDILHDGPSKFDVMKRETTSLRSTFKIVRSFWTDGFVKQITDAYNNHMQQLKKVGPPLASHTVSFLNPQDLLKVKNDLKSPWFKKYVVRGASIKKLEKFLQPFNQISIAIQELDKSWKWFLKSNGEYNKIHSVHEVVNYLSSLEKFVQGRNISSYVKLVEDSNTLIGGCYGHMKSQDIVNDFIQQEGSLADVAFLFKELETKAAELLFLEGNNTNTSFQQNFEKCLTDITFPKLDDPTVDPTTAKSNISNQYFNCMKVFGSDMSLDEILKYLVDLVEVYKKNKNLNTAKQYTKMREDLLKSSKPVVEMQTALIGSGINDTLKCLENVQYERLVNITKLVIYFLKTIPSSADINTTIGYTQSIAEVKGALQKVEEKIHKLVHRPKRSTGKEDLITTAFNNSKLHAENIGVCVLALYNLIEVRNNRGELLNIGLHFNDKFRDRLKTGKGLNEFVQPEVEIRRLLKQADSINDLSKKLKTKNPQEMSGIFEEISKLHGIKGDRDALRQMSNPKNNSPELENELSYLIFLNMDFALYESRAKDGYFTVKALLSKFDVIFGRTKDNNKTVIVEKQTLSWIAIICMTIGVVLLLIIVCLTIYGFTARGKEKYRVSYLYYFGKPEDFEKLWRYSCFVDKEDGKNALLDAVREVNKTNVISAVKKGAYIDAYNKYGNTALHAAAKLGYPEIVEILIRNGADRSLLNTSNQTAEQCVPVKGKENTDISTKLQAMFQKYKNKKFRKQVPLRFPFTSFHIYIEEGTDVKVTDQFIEKFKAIVEKVKFKGVVYDTVIQWSMAMAKSEIPYLHNVIIAAVMKEYDSLIALHSMVTHHGANMCETFPLKENYRIGARPYFHSHLGPLFLIHDGQADLTPYINDPDKMYTIFTEEEFLIFMLKREIRRNTSENPLSVFPDALLVSA